MEGLPGFDGRILRTVKAKMGASLSYFFLDRFFVF